MADGMLEWSSGVGGVQCDDCGRTTICRSSYGGDEWLCRPCHEGWDGDDEEAEDLPSSDASLGAASTNLNPPPGEHTNLGDSK